MMEKPMRQNRNMGIDLLRMVSMMLVIIAHVMGAGGILGEVSLFSAKYEVCWTLEMIAMCSVNCYALISGYVGYRSKVRYANLAVLWLGVVFYTVLLTILFAILIPGSVTIFTIAQALLPAVSGQYWYFSAYFFLFFLTPLLNVAIAQLEEKTFRYAVIGMLFAFSFLQVIFYKQPTGTSGGYSCIWLLIMYLVGGYFGRFGVLDKIGKKKALLGFAAAIVLSVFLKNLFEYTDGKIGIGSGYSAIVGTHISPTIIFGAIMLVSFFVKCKFSQGVERLIRIFSPAAFSVYIIHANPLVWDHLLKGNMAWAAALPAPVLGGVIVLTAIGIYVVCSLIDLVRIRLFAVLRIRDRLTALEDRILRGKQNEM